jgi:predicted alpha/beta hydrolase family esterase
MKKTVVLIEGGTTFDTYDDYISFLRSMPVSVEYLEKQTWRDSLQSDLGETFKVVRLQMQNKINAKYGDRYLEILGDDLVLLGHSLGATFLVKFLAEETIKNNISRVILVAAPFGEKKTGPSLGDFAFEGSTNFEAINPDLKITLFASDNDKLITEDDVEKYQKAIKNLEVKTLPDRGHFSQSEFPELISCIKKEVVEI